MEEPKSLAYHSGHRLNPFAIALPEDLDHACARVWDPTPAQAHADNYKMAHTVIGGLPVTIETPRGRMRHGAGMDGKKWSVQMPAHYGYVKRTIASDGDPVDVYVGEHAHMAENHPVWILDQCDENTKAYDEAKVFIGFKHKKTALSAYLNAFSDGRGADRIGGVARTTFAGLKTWLESGDTKKPVVMRKSASATETNKDYGPATCKCVGPCGHVGISGGFMTEPVIKIDTPATGFMARTAAAFAKGLAAMTPAERSEFVADAAVQAGAAIGKAEEAMETVGQGHDRIPLFEDQWDGPPDDRLETVRAHGPESSVRSGKVGVGPSQASSGNGAEKMEGEYSRHAPQRGVQRATELLGEAIAGIKAMKSALGAVVEATKAQGMQIEALKSGAAVVNVPDATAIQGMIDTAVGKAVTSMERTVAKAVRLAVMAKAEEKSEGEDKKDEDEEDDEEKDEEAAKAESASETEIAHEKEAEEEDDEKEADKAIVAKAALFRIMAKSRIRWANRRFAKAEEDMEENKPKKAERHRGMGEHDLKKARGYFEAAKALREGYVGPSTLAISKSLSLLAAKAKKMPKGHADADNQTTWPNKEAAGKAVPDALTAKALEKVASDVQQAMSGMKILTTTVTGLMESMGGQSRGTGLPPAFHLALAKGGVDDLTVKQTEIGALADAGVITPDERDDANSVIQLARMPTVPPEFLNSKIQRLPMPVQAIMTRQAA